MLSVGPWAVFSRENINLSIQDCLDKFESKDTCEMCGINWLFYLLFI